MRERNWGSGWTPHPIPGRRYHFYNNCSLTGIIKKYLLNIYYVPGTLLGAKDMAVNKRDKISVLTEHMLWWCGDGDGDGDDGDGTPGALSPPCASGSAKCSNAPAHTYAVMQDCHPHFTDEKGDTESGNNLLTPHR